MSVLKAKKKLGPFEACQEAASELMEEGKFKNAGTVQTKALVQMANYPALEVRLISSTAKQFKDINVIGMDLLQRLETNVYGLGGEFEFTYVAPSGA
ncbi:MAG: hypothetical protein SGILL_007018 [Bacillariaceae sp.]